MKRSWANGLALSLVVSVTAVAGTSAFTTQSASAAAGVECRIDAFGHTKDGRIKYRSVTNSRVVVSKTTGNKFAWRPVAWGLVSLSRWPGYETTKQIVTATDGKARLVETEWSTGGNLQVRVIKVLGKGYPKRLVTVGDRYLYWVAKDRTLHRITWNGKRLVHATTLPVSIANGARAMTAIDTDRGMRIYYTDSSGALHVVDDEGSASRDTVIRASGFVKVTGLRVGSCHVANYSSMSSDLGLLTVNRKAGTAQFRRIVRPTVPKKTTVTKPIKVRPSDWTWRRLG